MGQLSPVVLLGADKVMYRSKSEYERVFPVLQGDEVILSLSQVHLRQEGEGSR